MKGQTNAKLASKGIPGESVNITLLTNQESHSDLIGAVITVSYGGVDTEYVWEGSEVTVKIPAMMDYSISVSEVEGYATPEGFSATSQMGYSRKLEMAYQCELVTVNVSADEGSVSGYEVTIAKVNKYGDNNEYTQVEYIESNAKQYIDTGFIPDSNTRVVMDAEVPDSSSAVYVFGVNDWTSGARFQIRATTSSTTYTSDYGSSGINTQVTAAGRLIFDKNKNVCTIGGVVTEHTVETFTCASSLKLLAGVTTSGSHAASPTGKIYSCQIYDNDILVRDYIPVIDSNGVAGLWDKVNNIFYSSSSSTAFIAGNIDGDVIATQTTSSASYKISYGMQYVIRASQVDGFVTPSTQSFTALESSRNIIVLYVVQIKGVFIQDVYGNLHTENEWDGTQTANGIAVIDEDKAVVVHLKLAYGSLCTWNYADSPVLVSGVLSTTSQAKAIEDFKGLENTDLILSQLDESSAATNCKGTIFPCGMPGYLPSAGEWQLVLENIDTVESCLSKCNGYEIKPYSLYWTSTQYDNTNAWAVNLTNKTLYAAGKNGDNAYPRAFSPLSKLDDKIEFYVGDYKYECLNGSTWRQFQASVWNTSPRVGITNGVMFIGESKYRIKLTADSSFISDDEYIISGYTYYISEYL